MSKTARTSAMNSGKPTRTPRGHQVSIKEEEEVLSLEEFERIQSQYEENDFASDISDFLKDIRQRQAKKSTMINAAFENQRKALYSTSRKRAQEVSRDGIRYLETLKSSLLELKKHERSYEQYANDIIPLWHDQDDAINKLLEAYDDPLDDLFPRRADVFAASEQMIKENSARRKKALKRLSSNARQQLDESRKQEKVATDASNLIKHFKALMK